MHYLDVNDANQNIDELEQELADLKGKYEKFLEADRKYCGNTRGALAETLQELADRQKEYELALKNIEGLGKELSDLKANKGMLKSHGEVMVTMPNEEYKAIKQELADLKEERTALHKKIVALLREHDAVIEQIRQAIGGD